MNIDFENYFKKNVYPDIKDFDFVKDLEKYDHLKKGLSLNAETKNIQALSDYKALETMHCFRLKEEQIDSFPKLDTVKNLNLSGSDIENLNFLKCFPNLIYLNIDGCDDLESTDGISMLTQIKVLVFTANMSLKDYKELAMLTSLISLCITGTTAGSSLKMGNLGWITALKNLEYLKLRDISTPKSELSPIANLPHLKKLTIPEKSKVEQIAYLKGSLPNTECFYFEPFYTELDRNENLLSCTNCGEPKIRLVGRGKNRVICKVCGADAFNEHMKIYKKWEKKGSEENVNKQ